MIETQDWASTVLLGLWGPYFKWINPLLLFLFRNSNGLTGRRAMSMIKGLGKKKKRDP